MKKFMLAAVAAAALPLPAAAQDHAGHQGHAMPATPTPTPAPAPVDMAGHQDHSTHAGHRGDAATGPAMPSHVAMGSGTSRLPEASGGMHGLHLATGDWMVMAHGYLWGVYTDASGPRGDDMAFVQSMAMLSASGDFGGVRVEARTMLSLEPAMGRPGYPNLLATGETAFGRALVDRQHPHDLFMELAARVDVDVAPGTSLFLYGGPVAEPALGPSAFMHRPSARYLPLSPITHHWFDSTHITYGVVTAGVSARRFQIEASAFRGREPDEERWGIETPRLDSWSVRATWLPTPNLAIQASYGRLKSPEVTHRGDDEGRFTASATYSDGAVSATLAYSAKNRIPGPVLSAWLAEANWNLSPRHAVFGRIEAMTNDELFPVHSDPLHDRPFRVARFEGGYAYRVPLGGPVELALGGSVAGYAMPQALRAAYGRPVQWTVFAKLGVGN